MRVALLCAIVLLVPIISISDDLNRDGAFNDAAAIVVTTIVTMVLIALANVRSIPAPAYVIAFATPSDPRSPPRA